MSSVFLVLVVVFFFKQKTAYEMRISDWSSDVCSSDLQSVAVRRAGEEAAFLEGAGEVPRAGRVGGEAEEAAIIFGVADHHQRGVGPRLGRGEHKIGRASCRERVCQYV